MTLLTLYSTSGCHLCELAEALIAPLLPEHCSVEIIDIAESDQLIEQYGIRIPVLQRPDDGSELGWPFDGEDFLAFLQGD